MHIRDAQTYLHFCILLQRTSLAKWEAWHSSYLILPPTELDWLTNIKTLTFQYRACKERNLWKGRRWSFLWSSPNSRPSTNLTKSSWNKARTGKNLCLKHCLDIVELVELRNESAKLWGLWWFHSLVAWRLSVLWLGPKAPQCTYMHMV